MKTMFEYTSEIVSYIEQHIDKGEYLKLAKDYLNEGKKNICIVACGSSNNAANCAYYTLKKNLGVKLEIISPFTFTNYEIVDENTFYIVISQSGRSVNTLAVIDKLEKANVKVHFITDNNEMYDEGLLNVYHLQIGQEEVPFVTKGMAGTVFFLMAFARTVNKKPFVDLESFKVKFNEERQIAKKAFEDNKDLLCNIKRVHILGGGFSKAVASEGALKFKETLQVAASAYEIEEFLHGGNFELLKEHLVIMIDSDENIAKRIVQIKNNLHVLCDNYYVVNRVEGLDEDLSIIVYLSFFQTLVYCINVAKGNEIPMMQDRYLEFESLLKAKTINYYD